MMNLRSNFDDIQPIPLILSGNWWQRSYALQ